MFILSLIIGSIFQFSFILTFGENVWLDAIHKQNEEASYFRNKEIQFSDYLSESSNVIEKNVDKNMTANNLCNEVIFEGNNIKVIEQEKPKCLMEALSTKITHRQKRDISAQNLPSHFTIPSKNPQEIIKESSYIKMKFRVCAEPGAEVLVFDKNAHRIIFWFRNGGGTYQCNKFFIPEMLYDISISDSNQIQVEYRAPKSDSFSSRADYQMLDNETKEGYRKIYYEDFDLNKIFELEITYEELEFSYSEPEVLEDSSEKYLDYTANTIKTFIIPKKNDCSGLNCNFVGIQIEILELDLDFSKGDYILIGPGIKPRFWADSKSQIVARKIKEDDTGSKKIWVHTDSAFILFVTHNSLHPKEKAFRFTWKPAATLIEDYITDESSSFLRKNSIQLCFSGGDCDYWESSLRYDFIEEAVHIFNNYLIENEKDITTLIGKESVRLFDFENISFPNSHRKENYCRLNLAIASPFDESYPLVNTETVHKMFFGNENSRSILHNRIIVTDCVYQHISLFSILLPIFILLSISGFLVFIFWRIQQSTIPFYVELTNHK